jgi:two-component system cell cycle sensor histidine kinase/response regulator CckA
MKDQSKTKQVLINELVSLRKRNAELEQSESERKRAEEALRESEARYRALVENANDIVFRTDDAGYVTFGNRAGFRITGYEEEEIIGKHYSLLVRPDMRDEAVKFFGRQFVKGLQNTYSEYPILTKEGHEVWLGQNTQLLVKDGRVIGFQAVARDITERRKAEAVLKRSEEFFRAISENASDIILIADKKGTITYASPSVEHILGYKQEELIGKRSLDLIVPEDLQRAIQDFGKAIFTKGVLVPNAFRVRHKDGSERVLEGVGKNLFENASVAGFVMNVRDVTDSKKAEEALRESEERYRSIVENIVDVYYRTDKDGNIAMMSPSGASLLGYGSVDEIIGQNVAEAFYADPKERNKIISEIKDKGYVRDFEVTLKHRDGTPIPVSTSSRLYFREEGEVLGVEGVFRDIRERKKMEIELRESEEKYRSLIETTRDLIYTTDRKGFLTYLNPTIERALGYTHDEWNGKSFAQIVAPECIDAVRDVFRKAMMGESIPVYETDLIRKDGTRLSVEFNVTTLIDREGKLAGRYGIGRDITERKQAQEALREAHRRLDEIIEFLPDATIVIDADSKVIAWNRAIEEMTGVPKAEMIGKGDYEYTMPFYGERRPILIDLALLPEAELEKRKYDITHRSADTICGEVYVPGTYGGKGAYLYGAASRLRDAAGNIVGAIESIRDITEQKKTEDALRKAYEDLQDTQDQLIQTGRLAALGQLASGAAHEIRNPLNIMSLRMQVLEVTGKALDEDVRKAIDTCNTQIKRIIRVLDGLYEFSRIPQTRKAPNDLNKMIEEVIASQDKRFKEEGITPEIHRGKNIPFVMLDKEKITMVITHLVSNAVDAMRGQDTRHFRISTEKIPAEDKAGESVRLIVFDTGHGISEMDRARVFDPFFTTKDPDKGKGLGLAISYGIIREHGGTIRVENNHEGGVSFLIDFPVGGSATA